MPVSLTPRGTGRPDYSQQVSKVALSSPEINQYGYWASVDLTLTAGEEWSFIIDKWFLDQYDYVPEGYRFLLDHVEFTADSNVLMEAVVGRQDTSLTVYALGYSWGYQRVLIEPRRAYVFIPNTRPVFIIANYGDVDINVHTNVFGALEKVG